MPRDLIPRRGRTLLHGEAGKPTSAVGVASPKAVPRRGGGLTFGRRAAATGGQAAHGGVVSAAGGATFGRSGGARRTNAGAVGQKSRTRGGFRGPRGVRGRRGPGKNRGKPGLHPGARRAKNGRRRGQNGAFGRAKRRVRRALGAKKPPFARKRRATGLCWGENWRRKLAGRVGLFGTFRESSGGFGGKNWGFEKAFSRAYRKKPLFAPFLCRWRTVIGANNLVVRSGCYLGRKE